MKKEYNPIQQYCDKMGYQLAGMIDESTGVVVKPKPWWMPKFLYNFVIKHGIEVISSKP